MKNETQICGINLFSISKLDLSLRDNCVRHLLSWFRAAACACVCACVQGLTFQNNLWSPGPRRQSAPCLLRHQTTEAVRDTASFVVALCQVSPVVPLHQVLFTVEFIRLKAQSAHLSLNSPSVRYQTGISV